MVQQKPTIQNQPIRLQYERMKGIDGRGGMGDMPDFTHGKKK
jgi:hypothetical protein